METKKDADGRSTGRQLKLVRLIDEYDLDGKGAELERRWTAEDDEERTSLRDLADEFNRELLSIAMDDAGMQPLDGEVENIYRLLTDDDVSEADRTRTRRRLEREGVDVDRFDDDFVTYQAIRTFLISDRDAEFTPSERNPIESEIESINQLRGRINTVTESKLEQLRNRDQISLGEFRLLVDITVICEDCGEQLAATDLIRDGACGCGDPPPER